MIHRRDDELYFAGRTIGEVAERRATPFFLFDERAIAANHARLSGPFSGLPGGYLLDYSLKTSFERGVLDVLRDLGVGAMASCGWEVELALAAGFDPGRITLHGPCKSDAELEQAIAAGLGLIHVASEEEVDRLARVAAAARCRARISLRLPVPGGLRAGLPGWLAGRQGIPWDRAGPTFLRAASAPWLCPVGLGGYLGTQITRPERYLGVFGRLLRLAGRLQELGAPVDEITLGGGWPSDTLRPASASELLRSLTGAEAPLVTPRLERLAGRVAEGVRRALARSHLTRPPLLRLESGRGLIGSAGVLVTRVQAVRGSWIFVDGSHNLLPESLLFARRRVLPAVQRSGAGRLYHVAGRTVNTMDVLALAVRLPPLRPGDLLTFLDAGAYSLSRSTRYADLPCAAYLLNRTDEIVQVRRPERLEDIAAPMLIPGWGVQSGVDGRSPPNRVVGGAGGR